MTVSDKDCAALMMAIYGFAPDPRWDFFDEGADDGVCWGMKLIDSQPVIALRGSETLEDWIRDFDCVANPFAEGGLGPVHPGFLLGIQRVFKEAIGLATRPVITGHSLGAGRAAILAGFYMLSGNIPVRRVVFGEPKPGFAPLAKLLAPMPQISYCTGDKNGHDLVTDVPFTVGLESYEHPVSLQSLLASPLPNDPWGPFRYHHFQLYFGALGE